MILLPAASLWSQVDSTVDATGDGQLLRIVPVPAVRTAAIARMLTPPPVSGQSYPTSPTSEERSNYLRAWSGLHQRVHRQRFGLGDRPSGERCELFRMSDCWRWTKPRRACTWFLNYAPGFTFYQRESSLNEADQNASIDLQYRLSPHVTFSARDGFQKTSNVFNQPDLGIGRCGFRGCASAKFFRDCADCGSLSAILEMSASHSNLRQRNGRSQRNVFQSALSEPGPGSRPV